MADEQPGPQHPQTTSQQPAKREISPRLILLAALGLYLILFAVLNSRNEKVSFVFFSIHISLIVALVLAAVLGFLGGYVARELRGRRKKP